MSTLYADNYTLTRITEPSGKVQPADAHGRVRRLSDKITLTAELALVDVIYAGVLPAGAQIVDARLVFPADTISGQLEMGWLSNGTDSADPNGIFAAAEGDFGGAAVDAKMLGTAAAFGKKFADVETTLTLDCSEVSTDSGTGTSEFEWEVFYIVD